MTERRFFLVLEACESETLPRVEDGVTCDVIGPSQHGDEVEIAGTRDAIMAYVDKHFGDGGDPEWFANLPNRMHEVFQIGQSNERLS